MLLGHRKGGEMVFPERENSPPGRMPWSHHSHPVPSSSSKATSASETSRRSNACLDTNLIGAKDPSSDVPIHPVTDTATQTTDAAAAVSNKPETINHSPETPLDDQVAEVMTIPSKV